MSLPFNEINAIVLFGSFSRGDNDEESDLDVCIFTIDNPKESIEPSEFLNFFLGKNSSSLSITTYSHSTFMSMLSYSSLFLWHLKLEGRILHGEEYFLREMEKLNPFAKHREELIYHQELLNDLNNAYLKTKLSTTFDLAILFTIARNTCMILTHKYDLPSFGRFQSFKNAKMMFPDLPITYEEYSLLSAQKFIYSRPNVDNNSNKKKYNFFKYKEIVNALLIYALKKIKK